MPMLFFEATPEGMQQKAARPVMLQTPVKTGRENNLAIIGLAAHFGTATDINAFEQMIYNGGHAARELPSKRWRFLGSDPNFRRKLGLTAGSAVHGCFIDGMHVDYKRIRTPLTKEDQLIPQQLIALSTIDKAIQDSGLQKRACCSSACRAWNRHGVVPAPHARGSSGENWNRLRSPASQRWKSSWHTSMRSAHRLLTCPTLEIWSQHASLRRGDSQDRRSQ